MINRNRIYDNTVEIADDSPPAANIRISGFGVSHGALIDAQENYWGVTTYSEISDRIVQDEGDPVTDPVTVDVSNYRLPDDTIKPGTADTYVALVTAVHQDPKTITPALASNNETTISFTTPVDAAVTVKIYEEADFGGVGPPVKTFDPVDTTGHVGTSVIWNGTDDARKFVPPEAYVFKLEATAGGEVSIYDLPRPEIIPPWGNKGFHKLESDTEFNAFRNEFVKIGFDLQIVSARFWLRVRPKGENDATDEFWLPSTGMGLPLEPTPVNTTYTFVFDGRLPDGSLMAPPAAGEPDPHFTVAFVEDPIPVPGAIALKPNFVIVQGTAPEIPNLTLKSDPFLVRHSYDQVTHIRFCLDRDALVTVKILEPGVYDVNGSNDGVVATLADAERFAAAACDPYADLHDIAWLGDDPSESSPDPNEIVSVGDGVYTLYIEVTNPDFPVSDPPDPVADQSHLKNIYRGAIQVRQ